MLRLTRLTLSHFRSYFRAELEPQRPLTALFGPNGAGKTNLLEAISLLSPGRGLRRARPDAFERMPEGIGWKLSAALECPDGAHQVITTAPPSATTRTVEIDGKTATQIALGRIARIVWLTPAMDRLWMDSASERRAFLDRITMSLDPGHGEQVLSYEKAMRERNRLLKEDVRDAAWYDAIEAQLATSGAAVAAARSDALARLRRAQQNAETAFPQADLSIDESDSGDAASPEALMQAFAESRPRDRMAGRTLVGPHRADLSAIFAKKQMPARHCSTGEQKALLISLILANARAIAEGFGSPPILLLDEVSAHLDADRRIALYDELCALGAQTFMSGTGAELFDGLGNGGTLVEIQEHAGTTALGPAPGSAFP